MAPLTPLRICSAHLTRFALACGLAVGCLPLPSAHALVLMDVVTINHAIKYGAVKQNSGYQGLLGPNWIVGENGTLLNVYTPYMMLAAKAMRLNLPAELTDADLKQARENLGKELRYLRDDKQTKTTKFMLSFLGEGSTFHKGITAKLVGRGRGRNYEVSPSKSLIPNAASPLAAGASRAASHEAIVSFYFKLADQLKLEGDYQLIVTLPTQADPMVFTLNNDNLY